MKQVWSEISKVFMRAPAGAKRNSILGAAGGADGRDWNESPGVLEGWNTGCWRINPHNCSLSHEECDEPIQREGHPVCDMVVCAREERDAHSANIHIISPVTYRRRTGRDVRPSGEAKAS